MDRRRNEPTLPRSSEELSPVPQAERGTSSMVELGISKRKSKPGKEARELLWYKDAILYEVHVRAFLDSNADGIGDFRGLTQKLDYIQELGVTAIWLLPFYPSPLRDDGYDIADYYSINPIYGTLKDFKTFLREAHARNLRVITELVVNHTSDQHPWFQRSRTAKPGSAWRDFYVWSDTPDKYKEARIIFRDFEPSNWTWDRVANSYYWHRFYAHQPDLNFDNPQVHKEIARVLDFWFDLGVDGLRLDAVPYLYEREGTSCENLSETHDYLKELRRHVDEKYGDRMLLAEANQWPEEAVTYFGSGRGDECHMAFHFPLMPRLFMAVRMEDRVPLVDILEQTPPIPETSQWALFLRNHDELTLEMVTDEERDFMYRVYANDTKARINLGIRRRLAPLLGNDRKRIELLKLLLFSLPGTPVLYYGDEIGMGDNIFLGDRNGVRTPMQWSSDKNAGFSRASPQALYFPIILDPEYHYEAINVEAQQANPNSLFWWMKRALTLRKRYKAFGRGTLKFLHPANRKILAFVRQCENETILVVANLSRFPQPAQLDLAEFKNTVPVELFGRANFPVISEQPYFLTLSPHAAFWFSLEPVAPSESMAAPSVRWGSLVAHGGPGRFWEGRLRGELEERLRLFIEHRLWFGSQERRLKSVQVRDALAMPGGKGKTWLLLLTLDYMDGDPADYLLPVAFAATEQSAQLEQQSPEQIIARVRFDTDKEPGVLYAASKSVDFSRALLEALARRRPLDGQDGELLVTATTAWRNGDQAELAALEPAFGPPERSNATISFGDKYFLKLFHRLEPGMHPDLEVGRFLTERKFPNVAPVAAWFDYHRRNGEEYTAGVLTQFIPEAQDCWTYTLDSLGRYFERVRSTPAEALPQPVLAGSWLSLAEQEPSQSNIGFIGSFLELSRLLGQRTGELHLALASEPANRDFAPEPFTPFYQRALYQSMRNQSVQSLHRLRQGLERVPKRIRPEAEKVIALESHILKRLRAVHETLLVSKRTRCHGHFHLGQVLYTGKDFVFVDFEGESQRPLGERRLKRSPILDVAAMIRSFDYVSYAALFKQLELGQIHEEQLPQFEPWAAYWHRWVGATFLKGYLGVLKGSDLLPHTNAQMTVLLDAYLLTKALDESASELTHRPDWIQIPLRAVLELV